MHHVPKRELKNRARKAELPRHDRAWWRAESQRSQTDWSSIVSQYLEVIQELRRRYDRDVGGGE
jgi:hypothetical protein